MRRELVVASLALAALSVSIGSVRAADRCGPNIWDPAPSKSVCATLSFSPHKVRPGGKVTVHAESFCAGSYHVFCSGADTKVLVDGVEVTTTPKGGAYLYDPVHDVPDEGVSVVVTQGAHDVVFTIRKDAKNSCVQDKIYYQTVHYFYGPFVVVGTGGWSTPDIFEIDGAAKPGVDVNIAPTTPSPNRVWPGETIAYTVRAVASSTATSFAVAADVPAGTEFVAGSDSPTGVLDGSSVKWDLALPGEYVTVRYSVKVRDADAIKNLKSIAANAHGEASIDGKTYKGDASADVPFVKIALKFEKGVAGAAGVAYYALPVDGYASVLGTVELIDTSGKPVGDADVEIKPNQIVDPSTTSDPRFLVTTDKGARIFPGRFGGGTLDFHPQQTIKTDSAGHATFRVLAGSQAATEMLFEVDEALHTTTTASEVEHFTGAQSTFPSGAELFAALDARVTDEHARFAPSGAGSTAQTQDTLLEWLGQLRWTAVAGGGADPVMGRIEFAPIHSVGGAHAGIVFYPRGSSPNPLLGYMSGGGGAPAATLVLDVAQFAGAGTPLSGGTFHSLAGWEVDVGATAAPGRLASSADDDLEYFGWPYPGPKGIIAAETLRNLHDRAIADDGVGATVHSPVNLLFTDAQSRSLGVDAAGVPHFDLAGVIVRGKRNPEGYALPAGNYAVTMSGTGSGPATVEFAASGAASAVFTLASKKGATGTVAVDAATGAAHQATFRGASVAATAGLAFKLSGVPKKLAAGRKAKKVITVRDPWKKPVAGAVVSLSYFTLSFGTYAAQAVSDARGRATLSIALPPVNSSGGITVSAPGYVDATSVFTGKK